ncbi:MAG: tripartite tricarboxylate transporter permease [Candidatus Rokubacteria bacterium]|nr:tripartite tricarboxylate transporter permease [Candidatus Rokubacteria bacterium]
MSAVEGLVYGFSVALSPSNLLACLAGVVIGTLVGVLPGIGPVGAMALLLPSTFALDPTTALIMLAGIYYGSMYGGSTTSILVNVPGEAASVVTALDGYQMARRGRAGAALAVSAVGSFVAGTLGVLGLILFATLLAEAALGFGPPEYFALTVMGLAVLSRLSGGSLVKAFLMVGLGLALGSVGMEPISGVSRFTFGSVRLSQGIELVPVAMGLFGIAEILSLAETRGGLPRAMSVRLRELLPTRTEWRRATGPIVRGSILGFLVGLIPGPAAVLSTFLSYTVERRAARHPEEFGKGAIEGVAGPESANNGATAGALVPLLALGIPFAPATAVLLGALVIHGIQPGPLLMTQRPEIFWGVAASMYIGNAILLILNLPLIGLFVSVLRLPQYLLLSLVVLLCLVGTYSVNNSLLDLWVLVIMGGLGYLLRKLGFEPAIVILALVLGPMLEKTFRQTLFMARGDWGLILSRPLTLALLLAGLVIVVVPEFCRASRRWRARRAVAVGP